LNKDLNKTDQPQTFCNYYNENICRSCTWLELPYEEQIARKEKHLQATLGFLSPFSLIPSARSQTEGFRNKAKMTVTGTAQKPIIGILGNKNEGEDLDHGRELLACPIHHPKLNAIIAELPKWIESANLIPYHIANRAGELKGVILFYSESADEIYLRFVLRSQECVARIRKILPIIQARFPQVTCISANIQPIPHAILEGKEELILTPHASIPYLIDPLTLNLAPQAFVQTNSEVASKLYTTAADWVRELAPETLLELFCGQGAFSFLAAPFVKKTVGIEINPEAVKTANQTANRLGLHHLSFVCADLNAAKDRDLTALIQAVDPDCILVNPPRRGLRKNGIELILNQKPKHILYSSCSLESLSEDLKALSVEYRLERAQIFDLFPHTPHFEILTFLNRQ
jgi:23S rRNA (uracil747-C5)-methyltransferase